MWREYQIDEQWFRKDGDTGEVQRWVVGTDGGWSWLTVGTETAVERRERAQAVPVDVRRIDAPTAPVQTVQTVKTSRMDQAQGFALKTTLLGMGLAAAFVTVRYGILGAPLVLGAAVGWMFAIYAAVWLVAFVVDLAISPDGIMWMHTRRLWAYYEREQRHRMERDR